MRVPIYAAGLALGQIIKYFVNPDPNVVIDFWKWGVGSPITLMFVLSASAFIGRGQRIAATVLLGIATAANFYFNFRSLTLFSVITLSTVLMSGPVNLKIGARRRPLALAALALAGFAFQFSYVYAASNGLLGLLAKQKYERQSAGDLGGVIGGRAEILASIQAVKDAPIIGHGSWARDFRYVNLLQDLYLTHGYGNYPVYTDTIPTHSHLLGAWVEAGIFGAVFWLWVLVLAAKGTLRAVLFTTTNGTLAVFSGLSLIWDVMFSPYGAERTVVTPFLIIVMIFSLRPTTPAKISRKQRLLPVPVQPRFAEQL